MTSHSSNTPSDGDKTSGSQFKGESTQKPAGLPAPETPSLAPLSPPPGDLSNNNNGTGKAPGGTDLTPTCRLLPGIGERLLQPFLMQGSAQTAAFQPLKTEKKSAISGIGPTSRAECKRRLSSGGDFCNPYSPAGCGGEYCGQKKSALAGGDIM